MSKASAHRSSGGASGSKSSGHDKHPNSLPPAEISDKDAKISVWIDLENCPVHKDKISNLSCNIVDVLRQLGYCSRDISITAYADTNLIGRQKTKAIQQSGITLSHVNHIGKDSADHKMLEDFGTWAQKNEPPANLLIVSADTGFWPTMKTLKDYNYNIMMACCPSWYNDYPPVDTVICWEQLVLGNLYPAQIQLY